ncbi:MAG: hypothetical protein Q8N52_13210, partial [Acidobacteriota bacterium]|nr:hypothetical protein [Acidobacteriota bacterium]
MITVPLVLLLLVATPLNITPQAPAAAATTGTAVLTIAPPTYDSQIELDGTPIPGTGATRTLETPPLTRGRTYQY